MASDRAAFKLRDQFDSEVIRYASGFKLVSGDNVPRTLAGDVNGTKQDSNADNDELLAANKLDRTDFLATGTAGGSIPLDPEGGSAVSPLALLNRMSRILDQANVEKEGRFFVADPVFYELLMDENSKLINNDYAGGQDAGDILRNGRVVNGSIRGFQVFVSNNVVQVGTGAGTAGSAAQSANYGVALAGHMSAIATAQQLAKTEQYRDPNSFADIVRGMQLYGRKVLRSESLLTARYNVA